MNIGLCKTKSRLLQGRGNVKFLSFIFLCIALLSICPSLATAESVRIVDVGNFNSGEGVEIFLNLSANEKIELRNYIISYDQLFSKKGTDFIETIMLTEKRTNNDGYESSHMLASFSGTKEIRDLKDKVILLDNSSIAINIRIKNSRELELRVWSERDIFSEINMSTPAPEFMLLYQDETVKIPIQINNSGLVDEILYLEVTNSEFYTHKITYNNYRVDKIKLDSGEAKVIDIELAVDKDCTPGEYVLNIHASGMSSCFLSMPFIVEENPSKSLESLAIQLSQLYTSGKAGSEVTASLRVINSGNVNLRDIKLDIKPPTENWEIDVSKDEIDLLKPNEYEIVNLRISIPSSAENGDYFVDINGATEGIETEEVKLRVNVKPQSSSVWIGLIIIIIAIIGLLVLFKKYGRR